MTTSLYYNPFVPAYSNIGVPIAEAYLYFYYTSTSTLAPIFSDASGTVPLTNPVQANLAGKYPPIYMQDGVTYRVHQTDKTGATIGDDVDPYYPGTVVAAGDPAVRPDLDLLSLATVAALRLAPYATLTTNRLAFIEGYYAVNDGGGGFFRWDGLSSAADDAALVINPTGNAGAGRWLRLINTTYYDIRWFGAKNEAGFDNRAAIQAAIDTACFNLIGKEGDDPSLLYDETKQSRVFVPPGTWDVRTTHPTHTTAMLWIYKCIEFFGAGMTSSWLNAVSATRKNLIEVSPSDKAIWGGSVRQLGVFGAGGGAYCDGVRVTAGLPYGVTNHLVSQVYAKSCYYGIAHVSIASTQVFKCTIDLCMSEKPIANFGHAYHGESALYCTWSNNQGYPRLESPSANDGTYSFYLQGAGNTIQSNSCAGPVYIDNNYGGPIDGLQIEGVKENLCTSNSFAALKVVNYTTMSNIVLIDSNGIGATNGAIYGLQTFGSGSITGLRIASTTAFGVPQYPISIASSHKTSISSMTTDAFGSGNKLETYMAAQLGGEVKLCNISNTITDFNNTWFKTFDPPSVAAAGTTTTTVTCNGATLGLPVSASFSLDLQGITVTAYVSAANTVTVRFSNPTGGAIDLASGTLTVTAVQ